MYISKGALTRWVSAGAAERFTKGFRVVALSQGHTVPHN